MESPIQFVLSNSPMIMGLGTRAWAMAWALVTFIVFIVCAAYIGALVKTDDAKKKKKYGAAVGITVTLLILFGALTTWLFISSTNQITEAAKNMNETQGEFGPLSSVLDFAKKFA